MRSNRAHLASLLAFAAVGFAAATANAQQVVVVEPGPRRAVLVEGGPVVDGPRFRGGISLDGGGIFVSGYGLGLVGLSGRLGVQINDLIGVYGMPYFSLGGGSVNGLNAFTGTGGGDAVVDFTFADRFFVGAGGGYGIVGSAGGPEALFRGGFYPLLGRRLHRPGRRGLMIGVNVRPHFLSSAGTSATVLEAMGTIGFEAF
jgi:hypothetical protein